MSLYSGAGGFDLGVILAGFKILYAIDMNKDACETYKKNIGPIRNGDIHKFLDEISKFKGMVHVLFGGCPCQGISIAGDMLPDDPRNLNFWTFLSVVELILPKVFIIENVELLGHGKKWAGLRDGILKRARDLGYSINCVVLNAADYGVPQNRKRVFFIGFLLKNQIVPDLEKMMEPYKLPSKTVIEVLLSLDEYGTGKNKKTCGAKIKYRNPAILGKTAYTSLSFKGRGQILEMIGRSTTICASDGNITALIDNREVQRYRDGLQDEKYPSFAEEYYQYLKKGGKVYLSNPPTFMRRMTLYETIVFQTFPEWFTFVGKSKTSIHTQVGNAVPVILAQQVAKMVYDCLEDENKIIPLVQKINPVRKLNRRRGFKNAD
jgi:DNA (cytosine-5)-methyltransferase 1